MPDTIADIDRDLARLTAQLRHAELNGWSDDSITGYRTRIDKLLEARLPAQRAPQCDCP